MNRRAKIIDLPCEVLENVFQYLTFDEVAKNREVCRKFNSVCGTVLNRGFVAMERRHSTILKRVKSLLPRRESERRAHQLARHSDILSAIETRISMLRMTFMKYVEMNMCCFIPGKVIDEILRILAVVENTANPPRTHEVLQELRDISSMAMEHFDEKIAPNLKLQQRILSPYPPVLPTPTLFTATLPGIIKQDPLRKKMNFIQGRTMVHKQQITLLKDIVGNLVTKVKKQSSTIQTQTVQLREQSTKLQEQDTCIADLKRHVEEFDLKFADLAAELSRARDGSTSTPVKNNPVTPPETPTDDSIINLTESPPRIYKPNIKPRTAQVLQRSTSRNDSTNNDLERKRKLVIPVLDIPPNKLVRMATRSDRNEDESGGNSRNTRGRDGISFLSASLESILTSPISSIKSRKRKIQ